MSSFVIFESDAPSYHIHLIRQGVRQYLEEERKDVDFSPISYLELGDSLAAGDAPFGVVGWLRSPEIIRQLEQLNVPYLNLYESSFCSNVGLTLEFQGEGTLAAEFFIEEMKCEHLAFIGLMNVASSRRRCKEFSNRARAYGIEVKSYFLEPIPIEEGGEFDQMGKIPGSDFFNLMRGIGKPVGVFCSNDRLGLLVQYTAKRMGFAVPDEVSVIGVGGAHPPDNNEVGEGSVVQLDHVNQGRKAAAMMADYLTHGKRDIVRRLTPDGIAHRRTTIHCQVNDPLVRKAMVLIRGDSSISVETICARLKVARRTLETRFRSAVNTTVARTIDFERFSKARMLIRDTSYNNESIAGLAGYANREQMRRSFYRFARMNPREYRRKCVGIGGSF